MDTNSGIPNQGDWRAQLHPVSRQRIINKITEKLRKHIPVSGQEGLHQLQNLAQRFEDKIFTTATSQSDYLRKISLRMLQFEIKFQDTVVTNITSSLDMLTIETESHDTMSNTITPSLDMETQSQCTMPNNITSSLDMETESHGTMANNITSSLDMETESHDTMPNNMTSNQVGPINEPLDPAMDNNNGIPNQGDWRAQLHPGSRQRILNKIMEALKKHIPVSGQEGLLQLQNIAQRFEDKIFTTATSQSDYLRKISLRMLQFEIKFQGTMVNNITSSLDMLTLETQSHDTMPNEETESQGPMANNITSSLDIV